MILDQGKGSGRVQYAFLFYDRYGREIDGCMLTLLNANRP